MISQATQIEQAIAAERGDMLTIFEFIKTTNCPIDTFLIDRFWGAVHDDMLIYVDGELIRWMGYSAAAAKTRRQNYMKLLANKTAGVDYFVYSNDEYDGFLSGLVDRSRYPPVDRSRGKGKTIHLLVTKDCLKSTIMVLNTPCGDRIRRCYIDLENLVIAYIRYQCAHTQRAYECALETIRASSVATTRMRAIAMVDRCGSIGCVYFVECLGLTKIGYTYDLSKRLIEIQVCCPVDIRLVRAINTDRPEGLESELHELYASRRMRGEWFDLSGIDISQLTD